MKFGKTLLIVLCLASCFICIPQAEAGRPTLWYQSNDAWLMKPLEKLGRGIANLAFCWAEIPMKVYDTTQAAGGVAGLCYGPFRGVAYTIARVGVGVIDVVTFPFKLPDCPEYPNDAGWGYGPIMRPAWVIDIEHDWGQFVYDESTLVRASY